jgi:hypothetical protein
MQRNYPNRDDQGGTKRRRKKSPAMVPSDSSGNVSRIADEAFSPTNLRAMQIHIGEYTNDTQEIPDDLHSAARIQVVHLAAENMHIFNGKPSWGLEEAISSTCNTIIVFGEVATTPMSIVSRHNTVEFEPERLNILQMAVLKGFLSLVEFWVRTRVCDWHVTTSRGNTLMHLAAIGGHLEVWHFLLAKLYLPLNPRNADGNNPFLLAVGFGNLNMVAYFLKTDADHLLDVNDAKDNCMHIAATLTTGWTLKRLLTDPEHLRVFEQTNTQGLCPANVAVLGGYWEAAFLLMQWYTPHLLTPEKLMDLAVRDGNLCASKKLLVCYPAMFHTDGSDFGKSLKLAVKHNHVNIIRWLLNVPVGVQDRDRDVLIWDAVMSAIDNCMTEKDCEMLQALVDSDPQMAARGQSATSYVCKIFNYAVGADNLPTVQWLEASYHAIVQKILSVRGHLHMNEAIRAGAVEVAQWILPKLIEPRYEKFAYHLEHTSSTSMAELVYDWSHSDENDPESTHIVDLTIGYGIQNSTIVDYFLGKFPERLEQIVGGIENLAPSKQHLRYLVYMHALGQSKPWPDYVVRLSEQKTDAVCHAQGVLCVYNDRRQCCENALDKHISSGVVQIILQYYSTYSECITDCFLKEVRFARQ